MHHPTDRIAHTTAFVTPVVEHWLEREIAQWVHPMKDRSDDRSHHERTLLPRIYISLPGQIMYIFIYVTIIRLYIYISITVLLSQCRNRCIPRICGSWLLAAQFLILVVLIDVLAACYQRLVSILVTLHF